MNGVVISFDESDGTCLVSVAEAPDANLLVGRDVFFVMAKGERVRGKAIGVDSEFLLVKFDSLPLGIGQGSMVEVSE